MKTSTITIAGKEATIAYCFATEVIFNTETGCDLIPVSAIPSKFIAKAIWAAVRAYYDSIQAEPPFTEDDIIYNAEPQELVDAITEILRLSIAWYKVPAAETEAEKQEEKKNE